MSTTVPAAPIKAAAKTTTYLQQFMRKNVTSSKVGVVVSSGKMDRAVKVRIAAQTWNSHIRKHFPTPITHLVADPNNSLHEGDVVRISSGWRFSQSIRHVVTAIVAPFGPPVNERPPVLTEDQIMQKRLQLRLEKDVRAKNDHKRYVSIRRIKEAAAAGYRIPSLEEATRRMKLSEEEEAKSVKAKGGKAGEAHKGQVGQQITAKERRRARAVEVREEREAKQAVKQAEQQVDTEKREKRRSRVQASP